ncbi:hypothetical protein BaRGS_00022515 [Batillaria attramentaria]|uniref:Uncharacterized protein n=1 Tax=Batillaria attramentaria TaxID=370345 RepID=A0ABD0KGF5_9CAEN
MRETTNDISALGPSLEHVKDQSAHVMPLRSGIILPLVSLTFDLSSTTPVPALSLSTPYVRGSGIPTRCSLAITVKQFECQCDVDFVPEKQTPTEEGIC